MSLENSKVKIESYKFHHIDVNKCKNCKSFSCEKVCFRKIYQVINKETVPKCIVIENYEDLCVKCHMCTTVCKSQAITID